MILKIPLLPTELDLAKTTFQGSFRFLADIDITQHIFPKMVSCRPDDTEPPLLPTELDLAKTRFQGSFCSLTDINIWT